jgi:lipoprotein-anchoring transpeptidase ErfK/SrfK
MTRPYPLALSLAFACLAITPALLAVDDAAADVQLRKPAAKSAADLIRKQAPPVIASQLAAKVTPENCRLIINLATQRACLMTGTDVYIDTPISSGKSVAATPAGTFSILEKVPEHRSGTYGHFVDKQGQIVRAGVSMKLDAAPAGTHYTEAPMRYFCRFNDAGSGIHSGILPGYPAAHGSIRMPDEVAKLIFEKVKVGTPIEIRAE